MHACNGFSVAYGHAPDLEEMVDRRIQVVLGEAEPDAGFLRFVLEGEGFDLVGLASSDEELDRVLEGARPSVIVLDAGISAMAALRAKERMAGATIVTVWPDGVAALFADERVAPFDVVDSLGSAVRKAASRAQIPEPTVGVSVVLGKAIRDGQSAESILKPVSLPRSVEPAESPRRTARKVLVLAATWILFRRPWPRSRPGSRRRSRAAAPRRRRGSRTHIRRPRTSRS